MAERAVVQLQIGTVGIDRVKMHGAATRRGIPTCKQHAAIAEHQRVQVVTLVEGDLANAATVAAHDVQIEGRFAAIIGLCFKLRLTFIE